ncbi:HAD family hydrolase [Hoeflea prorocentri]|uniref:HAD family phosphatase n=1 Tax=Hoeflea prorocentri TaxID=1922333 RepID=A0A9X3UHS1_9HYPH|nr:HAD family phosphatase [Hoeflea prorocentri]MCY6381083.1 HAD family phosphatase [Hoeflea prorocentri]MDA5398883.1 HAD family phosphatase [Hoeflea prorocentri]
MTNGNSPPALVIFDCDGVLVDTEMAINEVMSANLARYGLQLTPAACLALFKGGRMTDAMTQSRKMGAALPDSWIDEIYEEMHARLEAGVAAVEGIHEVIGRLDQRGIDLCVASNGSEKKMSISLGHAGLWDRFQDVLFSAHTHGVAKPDPGLFQLAAERFGVAAGHCVVVEDSVPGVRAARAAAMPCYGYAEHDDGKDLSVAGAEVFRNMRILPGLLGI